LKSQRRSRQAVRTAGARTGPDIAAVARLAAIASSPQSPSVRLTLLLEEAVATTGARSACLWLFDRVAASYVVSAQVGLREDTASGWRISAQERCLLTAICEIAD